MPDADYLYACDQKWWKIHLEAIRRDFKGQLYTQYHNDQTRRFAEQNGIQALEGVGHGGLGREKLHHGSNSGYQAINFAYLMAKKCEIHPRIILLGYDMGKSGGKNHWFGDHPKGMTNGNYESFVGKFTSLAEDLASEGVEVINCSRQTKLTQFKRATIDDI